MWNYSNGTRLENAHALMHHRIAEMIPKLESKELSWERFESVARKLRQDFEAELLENEAELIEFLKKNRLEIEAHWQPIIDHFNSGAVYQAIFDYYARNFYTRSRSEILEMCERITNRKFDII